MKQNGKDIRFGLSLFSSYVDQNAFLFKWLQFPVEDQDLAGNCHSYCPSGSWFLLNGASTVVFFFFGKQNGASTVDDQQQEVTYYTLYCIGLSPSGLLPVKPLSSFFFSFFTICCPISLVLLPQSMHIGHEMVYIYYHSCVQLSHKWQLIKN